MRLGPGACVPGPLFFSLSTTHMTSHLSDRVFGALVILMATFMAWGTEQIQESFIQDPLGPKVFPWLIAAVMGLSGLYMVLRPDASPHWPSGRKLGEMLFTVAVMVAYAQWLPDLGFVLSTALVAGFLSWRLGSTVKQATLAGALLAIGIYLVFHSVLGLSLARGPWGF